MNFLAAFTALLTLLSGCAPLSPGNGSVNVPAGNEESQSGGDSGSAANDEDKPAVQYVYSSLEGLVMTGYQGWFNAPDDGAGLRWKHYEKDGEFRPGKCSIDLWPDVSDYNKVYETEFSYSDGSPAYVFSSADPSTTRLHFKWMKQYGIDGAFVQRFVTNLKSSSKSVNSTNILLNCVDAAQTYGRAVCVMYDLSGMKAGDSSYLIDDIDDLILEKKIAQGAKSTYLHHNGKPLVAVWGVGFSDSGRAYDLAECEKIVDHLRELGCSVLLGVPAKWRTLTSDAVDDPHLLELIKKADVVHPWFVGRYDFDSFKNYQSLIQQDIAWCRSNGLCYIPTVFPGFSWYNLKGGESPLNKIPRLEGRFLWSQMYFNVKSGAKCLYVAMFDEIDEGTAIFKCSNRIPVGDSSFLTYEGVPSDRYMWLVGQAGVMLRGESPLSSTMPVQP